MSLEPQLPLVEAAVVVLERAGLFLVEYNPRWQMFTLPMARLRVRAGSGELKRETPLEAAVRAATTALGRPLDPASFPRPLALDVPPRVTLSSRRDLRRKRYDYHVFGRQVTDAAPRHAMGWHVLWLKPVDLRTHVPVSPTAKFVVEHLAEEVAAV